MDFRAQTPSGLNVDNVFKLIISKAFKLKVLHKDTNCMNLACTGTCAYNIHTMQLVVVVFIGRGYVRK